MSTTAMAQPRTVTAPAGALAFLSRFKDYLLPLAAISVIFVMLVPLPAAALDLLLALSMAASMIVFLSAVQVRRAVEMSVFPHAALAADALSSLAQHRVEPADSASTVRRERRRRAMSSRLSGSLSWAATTWWASCSSSP